MVFGCISKNFPENIFWCLEKKKENTNPEKHKPQPRKKSSTTTLNSVRRLRRRSRSEIAIDGAIAISRRRDRDLRKFAPSIAILIRCDLAKARSRSTARSRSSRDHDLREIAPSIAISIRCDLAKARSRSTASRDRGLEIAINDGAGSRTGDRGRGLEIADWRSRSTTARSQTGDRDLARARSLSLSLIFRKHFEGKIEV